MTVTTTIRCDVDRENVVTHRCPSVFEQVGGDSIRAWRSARKFGWVSVFLPDRTREHRCPQHREAS